MQTYTLEDTHMDKDAQLWSKIFANLTTTMTILVFVRTEIKLANLVIVQLLQAFSQGRVASSVSP